MLRGKRRRRMTRRERRDFFVKKWLQLRIISTYLLILLGGAGGLAFYLHGYCRDVLRYEMFGGHSIFASPWEILRGGVLTANAVAVASVTAVTAIITFAVTLSISKGARRVTDNLRLSIEGGSPSEWALPPRHYEFQQMQHIFSESLEKHYAKVSELSELSRLLEKKVQDTHAHLETEGPEADPALLRDLHVQCEKLKSAYEKFVLPE